MHSLPLKIPAFREDNCTLYAGTIDIGCLLFEHVRQTAAALI
jgi:hypothetical protein